MRNGMPWRFTIAVVFLAGQIASGGRAWAINSWERWETDLISSQARTPIQAYHDVQIEATFWLKSGTTCTEPTACTNPNSCFKGLAFWDGDAANPGRFKLRSAFPAGTWCWKTCLLPRSGSACTPDTGLNRSGDVSVITPAAPKSPLYANGFLKAPAGKRNLTYWNGQTPFQWLGDTAWNAPINYASNRTLWSNYVNSRAKGFNDATLLDFTGGGGFTNILVAPAVQTAANPPAGGFRGFVTPAGCGTGSPAVVPASCHYWDSAYWRDFDNLVKVANDAGIVIVVAGLIDPLNRAGTNQQITPVVKFPARADAAAFARNLAARLAGSFVVFSPSFDSRVSDPIAEADPTVKVAALIDAVGTAIRAAAPRHLIGTHLAGGSALGDYDQFQNKSWLSHQVFQSGHGSAACEGGLSDDYAKFACRARDFALRFRCIGESATALPVCANAGAPAGLTKKPAVNVEGKYETIGDNLTRVQSRHVGWNSALSGSFGYNIGVWTDIATWTNPAAYSSPDHNSDNDLGRMKGLFKSMPWSELIPRHDVLVELNNLTATDCGGKKKADWLQLWKPHFAIDATRSYAMAYLPRPTSCQIPPPPGTPTSAPPNIYKPTTSIAFDASKAAALGISCTTWEGYWESPELKIQALGFTRTKADCTAPSGGPVRFTVPFGNIACDTTCDRVLVLKKITSGQPSSPNISMRFPVDLQVSSELSEDGQTSTIVGQLIQDGVAQGNSIPLSGPESLFRKLPSVALEASGNFLVVWEEESSSGTDDIIAARFSPGGEPLGPPVVLNETTEGQQGEPMASGDDSGNTVVVWTSYNENDEIAGDIFGRLLAGSGQVASSEFLVSTETMGNQSMPQVQMDGDGGFVVAWTKDPPAESPDVVPIDPYAESSTQWRETVASSPEAGVYFRVYGSDGRPRGPERRVEDGSRGRARLSKLEVHRHGGFKISWREFDESGRDLGEREQEHDRNGNLGRVHP